MPKPDLTARYVQLAEELGEKVGRAHGWRRRVAEQLGVDESTLSKILKGTRLVGMDLAERAIERLNLSGDYFWTSRENAQLTSSDRAMRDHDGAVEDLIAKFDNQTAKIADVYALARVVAESPAVIQAQQILNVRKPKSEQEIGALFLAASKLIDFLRRRD